MVLTSILVRGLDDHVKQQLAAQAKRNGRSMEAEARLILTAAVSGPNIGLALLEAAQQAGGVELDIPSRSEEARAVSFD